MDELNLLHKYYDALCKIHPHQAFWVFDRRWNVVYANSLNYNFSAFKIHFYHEDRILDIHGLTQLVNSNIFDSQLSGENNSTELLAYYEENGKLNSLLLEVISLKDSETNIGYVMLDLGPLYSFESSNIVNMILFGASKKDKSGVADGTRLLEICFFLMRGKNYREIAEILSKIHNKRIASSTIGNMVRNFLYPKFDVCNRMALKKAIHQSDICSMLPKTIFNNILESSNG